MPDNTITDREGYVAQHKKTIEDCLASIRRHLASIDDLFEVVDALREEVQVWELDIYGDWQRTMLSALPKDTQKAITRTRQQVRKTKQREETERRLAQQAADRRAEEAKALRREARQN